MAELKRTFVKGGMNLDLDERLVGQGMYREALNIRVSSSSEGNEGSLETVKANEALEDARFEVGDEERRDHVDHQLQILPSSIVNSIVGNVVDKSTDIVYLLVADNIKSNSVFLEEDYNEDLKYTKVSTDSIYEHHPETNTFNIVFNDVYEMYIPVVGVVSNPGEQTYIEINEAHLENLDVREDMRIFQHEELTEVVAVDPAPVDAPINQGVIDGFYVDYIDRANSRIYVKDLYNKFNAATVGQVETIRLASKRILGFSSVNGSLGRAERFNIITGLNVFDGLIFFTDGEREPKKLNIQRCKDGTLGNPSSVYPSWVSDRRFFHTRLLKKNTSNVVGFQNVSEYDFFGDINNGTGGMIEPHCTVIRPNPEEHLKIESSVGAITSETTAVGPRAGVITHPFPIHPSKKAGDTLQFCIAYANELGFFDFDGALLTDASVPPEGGPLVDQYYSDNFLAVPGVPGGGESWAFTLAIPDILAAQAHRLATYPYNEGIHGLLGTQTDGLATDPFFAAGGYQIDSMVSLYEGDGNAAGEGLVSRPLFRDHLNVGVFNAGFQLIYYNDILGLVNDPGVMPSAVQNYDVGDQYDGNNYQGPTGFIDYAGVSGNRNTGTGVTDQSMLMQYWDVENPKMDFQEAFNLAAYSEDNLEASPHPIVRTYHRGGLLSKTNLIGSNSDINTVSEYWGIGDDSMQDLIHNGEIKANENGLIRPTTPGRFVVQPHGFQVGDIVVLKGLGNTYRNDAVGTYKDQDFTGNSFDVLKDTIENDSFANGAQGGGSLSDMYTEATAGAQDNAPWFVRTRKHDGYMDNVKAKIVKIEHVNIRENDAVINGEIVPQFIDNYGNAHNLLTDRFMFLSDKMVGDLFSDGSDPDGEVIEGVQITPSFFSTPSYASQYVFTIEILENNRKKDQDPTLRADMSARHLNPDAIWADADNPPLCGFGDPRLNAAMLPENYEFNKSPYFQFDQGWGWPGGGVSAPVVQGDNEQYFGAPLPQVWAVTAASDFEEGGTLSDERALRETMLRFSYRYQYEDNEYSGFAPFTTVVWRTLNQKIDWPNYYISLINEITDLRLLDWSPKNIPQDVKAVELVVKSEEASNIYALKKYDYRQSEYTSNGNGTYRGVHEFNSNTLGLTIEPNQILRPFDSVPRAAKAQEISANRVIYGNYLKDYNLEEVILGGLGTYKEDIRVNLEVGLHSYINQTQGEILGPDGNAIAITLDTDENAIETFEDAYSNVNPNFGLPLESVKSYRSYQVGIVYRDEFGRETPVLTNKKAVIKVGPDQSKKSNRLKVIVKNPHPTWAKSYKFFVKDTSLDYHVLPLEQIKHYVEGNNSDDDVDIDAVNAELTEQSTSCLIFSSDHRNKIQEGDVIIQKRPHKITTQPDPSMTTITHIYEPDNPGLEYEVQTIKNEAPENLVDAFEGNEEQLEGKFFVFVKTDRPLVINNNEGALPGPNTAKTQAVFETRPKPNYDVDLYYEASQAYPVVLDDETDEQFIKPGRMVLPFNYTPILGVGEIGGALTTANGSGGNSYFPTMFGEDSDGDGLISYFDSNSFDPITVVQVNTLVGRHSENDELYTEIKLSEPVTLNIPVGGELCLRIQNHLGERMNVGEYIHVVVAEDVVDSDTVLVKRHTHASNFGLTNDIALPISLPWYNCFSFGNGIEISTARNAFNGARLQKGVKASSIYEDYAEVKESTGLIFSGVYNSYSSFNETNQFIEALGITKRFNPDHGSIQKLFSRANDLIVLCEDKILKVLSQKDAIFKADGNPDLLATNRVLGQSVAFDGEYGISNNPESFAHYGFRSYFTDAKRGVVLRLSKDGLTKISDVGMDSFFKTRLANVRQEQITGVTGVEQNVVGSYDIDKEEYLVSSTKFTVFFDDASNFTDGLTVAWSEDQKTWTSFRSYVPTHQGYSVLNKYYAGTGNTLYQFDTLNSPYMAYDGYYPAYQGAGMNPMHRSKVALVYNEQPGIIKDFTYTNYEGSQAKIIGNASDEILSTNLPRKGWWIEAVSTDLEQGMSINFKKKENKWHNNIMHKIKPSRINLPSINEEEYQQRIIAIGRPTIITTTENYENGAEDYRFIFNFEPGDVNMSLIQQDQFIQILKYNPETGLLYNSIESLGNFVHFGEVESWTGNSITTKLMENDYFNARNGYPFTYPFGYEITQAEQDSVLAGYPEMVVVLKQAALEHSSVKGYFAKATWINDDDQQKSELFAATLNAVESSK